MESPAEKLRLQQFSGQSSISSADYFGRDEGNSVEPSSKIQEQVGQYAHLAVEKAGDIANRAKAFLQSYSSH
jgi:hypothetical protein